MFIKQTNSIREPNTGKKNIWLFGHFLVWILNAFNMQKPDHISPVFEWFNQYIDFYHSKTRPFGNQTHLEHLKTGLVRYLDGYCIKFRDHS